MPLRIGFDMDGVLADMEGELVRQAEVLFGEAMTRRLKAHAEATQQAAESRSTSAAQPVETSDDTPAASDVPPSNAPTLVGSI